MLLAASRHNVVRPSHTTEVSIVSLPNDRCKAHGASRETDDGSLMQPSRHACMLHEALAAFGAAGRAWAHRRL